MTLSKADLFKNRLGVEDVEIPGVGTVRIRSLSMTEAEEFQGKQMPVAKLLSVGVVDPELSEEDAATWMSNAPAGEFGPVVAAIISRSGLEQAADKEAVKSFRG